MTHKTTDFAPLKLPAVEIRRFPGKDCPPELLELRRLVWEQETGLLPEEELFNENDRQGIHLLVYDRSKESCLIASTCAVEAERSDFAVYSRLPEEVLRDTVLSTRSTVHPDYRGSALLSLLIYLGGREGRMWGRRWMAGFLERGMAPGRKVSGAVDLDKLPPRRVKGRDGCYEVVATAVDVNYVMSKCFRRISEHLHPYLREYFFADEIVTEVMRGAKGFYEGPWFKAVEKGELTRWQYFNSTALTWACRLA